MTAEPRREHPPCAGCRHESTYGVITQSEKVVEVRGQCLRYSGTGQWPHGCRHFVERAMTDSERLTAAGYRRRPGRKAIGEDE